MIRWPASFESLDSQFSVGTNQEAKNPIFLKDCYWSICSIQVLTANITFSLQPKFSFNLESRLEVKTCFRPCEVIDRLDIDIANGHRQVFGLYASKKRRSRLQDLWHDAVAQLHGFAQNPETQQKSAKGRFGGVVSIEIDIPGCREILEVRVAPSVSCATNGWIAENQPM